MTSRTQPGNRHEPASTTKPVHALIVAIAAIFTDMLLSGLAAPILPLLPTVVDAGPGWAGVLFASYAFAMVIATVYAGWMVDRYGPKTPLLIGLIGMGLATFCFALGEPFSLLLIARLAQGFSGGITWVAALALIAATTPLQRRGSAFGIAIGASSLGFLVGPPLAGVMATVWGSGSPFIFAGLIAIIDGILRIVLVNGVEVPEDDTGGPLAVLRVPGSWSIIMIVICGAALPASIQPVLPLHLHIDELTVGMLYGISAIAVLVFNPLVGWLTAKVPVKWLVGCGVVVSALALGVLGSGTGIWEVGIAMVLVGLSGALLLTPATTLISEQGKHAQPPTLGGTFSLNNLAYGVGMVLGPLLSGLGSQDTGYFYAFLGTNVVITGIGAVALFRLPRLAQSPLNRVHDQ
ncbi:MFS transporter [Stomatohabitans albus]|uniref:MFS transporter n=1 Tax=Stomatohabitans albus TaxID=3110766 RepID=UPI00300D8991